MQIKPTFSKNLQGRNTGVNEISFSEAKQKAKKQNKTREYVSLF